MYIAQKDEVRYAYFLKKFDRVVEPMRIISFGACNYSCPYCKREDDMICAKNVTTNEMIAAIDEAVAGGQRIRLSGGDPSMFSEDSLLIARHIMRKYGQKISIAHNGSNPLYIEKMLPYIDYLALDFKGGNCESIAKRAGMKIDGESIDRIIEILDMCEEKKILVDVRTMIFGDTTMHELEAIAKILAKYKNVFWTLRGYSVVAGCNFTACDKNKLRELSDYFTRRYAIPAGCRDKWSGCNFYISQQLRDVSGY